MKSWAYSRRADGSVEELPAGTACVQAQATGFTWIHLDGRQEEAREWLLANAGLAPEIATALLAVETRPRCLPLGEGALINLRGLGATPEDDNDVLVSVRIWIEQGRVISISFRSLAAMPELRAQMEKGQLLDPGDLIAALARLITGALDPDVAALGDEVDECEEKLDPSSAYTMRRLIARARAQAIAYRRFVAPQRAALDRLASLEGKLLEEDDRFHLRDAADRFARMAEELESVRERAALLHEQLTDLRSETMDMHALLLSIVALVFLPLTFLTGLLGMNVEGIPFAKEPWAFWGVVGICLVIAVAISAYFLTVRWLKR